MNQQELIYGMLREFADGQQLISAVYAGVEPEEGFPMYFFLTANPRYVSSLEDAITDLEIEIQQKTGENVRLMRWPVPPSRADDYTFLGDCIYSCQRD